MTTVQIFNIEEAGQDYVLFKDADTTVRVKFADETDFTKEDNAGFFHRLVGKPAALSVPIDRDCNFFIAVDMWPDSSGNFKVVPFHFATETVQVNGVHYAFWRKKLASWKAVRVGSGEPCWLCDEIRDYTTYEHPDSSRSADWAYDVCGHCEKKLGLTW